ncbi:HAD hydrolase family protein [Oceanicola sp. 22II-s10i]|uniref:HAD hydrolase family protein n=1 Tax=Oceanicola sp. 22II-s10i TaxID=1317116 RepID=UPI001C3E669D|nr:HAD hydrolase family protein [Oceanicola sp. 22II-s10i]
MSTGSIIDQLAQRITAARAKPERDRRLDIVAGLSDRDTVVALVDPNLQPLGILLETSIWESAICSIQLSDVRNFSHGRHAWLQHLQDRTLVLGITGSASHDVWANLKSELPDEVRAVEVTYNTCGRLEIALALIDGLGWLEAMGEAVGRDPGKPGIGQFGRRMFEDPSLRNLAWQLAPAVRQKLARLENTTSTKASASDLFTAWKDHFVRISEAEIGGLVLDYDGTVVTTEGRFDPPEPKIVSELVRLRNAGIDIAFASGRGKSLGRDVRAALPPEIVDAVLIGYYNGGLIRSANVDITESEHVPPSDPALEDVADWVRSSELLLENQLLKHRPLQITINAADLNSPRSFQADILECPTVRQGRAVVVASAHSFDIIPASSSKLRVLEELERRVGGGQVVLSVGDSGSERGNDNALLSRPYGVSVGDVCGAEGGCWSAFGEKRIGPTALCDILRALKPTERGGVRLDLDHLGLDERFKEWCKG